MKDFKFWTCVNSKLSYVRALRHQEIRIFILKKFPPKYVLKVNIYYLGEEIPVFFFLNSSGKGFKISYTF